MECQNVSPVIEVVDGLATIVVHVKCVANTFPRLINVVGGCEVPAVAVAVAGNDSKGDIIAGLDRQGQCRHPLCTSMLKYKYIIIRRLTIASEEEL